MYYYKNNISIDDQLVEMTHDLSHVSYYTVDVAVFCTFARPEKLHTAKSTTTT